MEFFQIRDNKSLREKVIYILTIITCIFHLYVAWFGMSVIVYGRYIHLLLMGILVILVYPLSKKTIPLIVIDIALIVSLIIGCFYLIINYKSILMTLGRTTNIQVILGILMIIFCVRSH